MQIEMKFLIDTDAPGIEDIIKLCQKLDNRYSAEHFPWEIKEESTQAPKIEREAPKNEASEQTKQTEDKSPDKVDFEELRALCADYKRAHGREALIEIFHEFGANKLPEVKESDRAELMEVLKDA